MSAWKVEGVNRKLCVGMRKVHESGADMSGVAYGLVITVVCVVVSVHQWYTKRVTCAWVDEQSMLVTWVVTCICWMMLMGSGGVVITLDQLWRSMPHTSA